MQHMLLQNATVISLQNVTKVYCKMCQAFYYKIQQFNYKMRQLLQNATFITKCVGTLCKLLKEISEMRYKLTKNNS